MSHGWLNVRIGRYFIQAWGWHGRVLRMDDRWVERHGARGIEIFTLFGVNR